MVFYAYARRVVRGGNADESARWIIAASSQEVVDEWWRVVSEKSIGIQRITPDFYLYDKTNIRETVTDQKIAPEFANKLILMNLHNDNNGILSIIPHQRPTDNISGNSFYIRSKSDPTLFWWETGFKTGQQIIASRQGRTKFRVQIKGKGHHDGQVMIGSDDIHISPILRPNFFVSSTESSGLVLGKKADTYAFSDFKGGFTIDAKDSNSEEIGNFYVLQSDQGDEWELVA